MKQLLQSVASGEAWVADVPIPALKPGYVLVRNAASLVSAGTERMVVEFAQKNLVGKARSRPDLVRRTLQKVAQEGPLATLATVRGQLSRDMALGYSSAGVVIEAGEHVGEFNVGDYVACAGGGYAAHAEMIVVPRNLVVKLPANVDFESAAFTTLGAIALHGLRLAELQLGDNLAVIGLGLLGQLTVQLAKAAGGQVFGVDIDPQRVELARCLGTDLAVVRPDAETVAKAFTVGYGFDAVIITAATERNDPVELAGAIARDKGRVVAVGAVGMTIPRNVYYEKELDFCISRSYGPGRYDSEYEKKGQDYPYGYVRWTENRNMQAFVQLLAEGKVNVQPLITHRFPIEEAPKAYDLITGKTGEPFLGVLITYPSAVGSLPSAPTLTRRIDLKTETAVSGGRSVVAVGLLGAGNFATSTLLPAMKKVSGIEFVGVCAATGLSARHAGDKFGFRYCTTDEDEILKDPNINTVVIATRHHLHARQVIAALETGKHVFCEKPLCLNEEELQEIVLAYEKAKSKKQEASDEPATCDLHLVVGFNRRFAPLSQRLKAFFAAVPEPLMVHYRVNAGYIPPDHWAQSPEQGGGRIIGEICHFVDFIQFLAGCPPVRVYARALPNMGRYRDDNVAITLDFANGSVGTVTYVANGDRSIGKEYVEAFGGGRTAVLDNYRRLDLARGGLKKTHRLWIQQDKGHRGEWEMLTQAMWEGGSSPIPFKGVMATMLATFAAVESLRQDKPIEVDVGS